MLKLTKPKSVAYLIKYGYTNREADKKRFTI